MKRDCIPFLNLKTIYMMVVIVAFHIFLFFLMVMFMLADAHIHLSVMFQMNHYMIFFGAKKWSNIDILTNSKNVKIANC